MSEPVIFTFSPRWGLPSTGPFALKLLAWLNHAGITYTQAHEDRAEKGPLGKSPWMEHGGQRMGDSDAIIGHLANAQGMDDPRALNSADDARADAMKIAFEERFHQILEWELFVHPEGAAEMRRIVGELAPPVLAGLIATRMIRHFTRQLHARGIARLGPQAIADLGRRQLDGLELCLATGDGWLGGNSPALADFAIWGQVAPMLHWPMRGPVASHARALPAVADWHARIMAACFDTRAAA
ncbi:MAG: hypothetical protein JJT95_12465 [Pararhodobacter sp.]|nr:hypothetical protein [Pararhodobacter sp.]